MIYYNAKPFITLFSIMASNKNVIIVLTSTQCLVLTKCGFNMDHKLEARCLLKKILK